MCIFRRLYIIGMIILGFFYGWDVPLNWLSYLIQNNLLKPTSSRNVHVVYVIKLLSILVILILMTKNIILLFIKKAYGIFKTLKSIVISCQFIKQETVKTRKGGGGQR